MVVSLDAPGDFLIDSGTCAQGIPCQIGVWFHPLSAGANKSSSVTIRDRITGGLARVYLGGTGGLPQISVSPSSVVFPSQAIGSTWGNQYVTVTNTGDAELRLSGVTLSGANSGDFAVVGSCVSMDPGDTCQVTLGFVPHALGDRSATLQIISNSKTDSTIEIPVSATSTPVP